MLRNLSVITQLERSRAGFCTQVLLLPRTPLLGFSTFEVQSLSRALCSSRMWPGAACPPPTPTPIHLKPLFSGPTRSDSTPCPHLALLRFLAFSNCVQLLSHVRFFATSWTIAPQAPLSMGFSRQEYWSGLPFPSPGDFPHLGVRLVSRVSCIAGGFSTV